MNTSTIERIFSEFDKLQVRYVLVGGLAVLAHGFVRLTHDVDIVLDMREDNIRKAMSALTLLGYTPRVPVQAEAFAVQANREKWINEKGMVVFSMISDEHRDTIVDLFVKEPFDFNEEYRLATRFKLHDVSVPVVRLSRLLLMKKAAARPKDLLDIEYLETIAEAQVENSD